MDWRAIITCVRAVKSIWIGGRLYGLLFGLLIALGVAGGFYLATALQRQIEALIGAAVVIGFLTWLGSGADLMGLLRDWYKDKRESERTPTINHTGIFKIDYHEEIHEEKYTDSIYYLRVELVKGEGMVNKCHASITVQQTSLSYAAGTWRGTPSYQISISRARPEFLELFRLRQYDDNAKPKHFIFYSASLLIQQIQQYDIVNNVLSVTWGSENGNIPNPYTQTIQQIIDESHVISN